MSSNIFLLPITRLAFKMNKVLKQMDKLEREGLDLSDSEMKKLFDEARQLDHNFIKYVNHILYTVMDDKQKKEAKSYQEEIKKANNIDEMRDIENAYHDFLDSFGLGSFEEGYQGIFRSLGNKNAEGVFTMMYGDLFGKNFPKTASGPLGRKVDYQPIIQSIKNSKIWSALKKNAAVDISVIIAVIAAAVLALKGFQKLRQNPHPKKIVHRLIKKRHNLLSHLDHKK